MKKRKVTKNPQPRKSSGRIPPTGYDAIFGAVDVMGMVVSEEQGNRKSIREQIHKQRKKNNGNYKGNAPWNGSRG